MAFDSCQAGVTQNPALDNMAYRADALDPCQAGRSNPVMNPPPVPAMFPTATFNPATDF